MSRYESLTRHLEGAQVSEVLMSFDEIGRILQRDLPSSAYQHQAWWANTTTHSHADAWMRAGWKTSKVNLTKETVLFVRTRPTLSGGVSASPAPEPIAREAEALAVDRTKLSSAALRLLEDYREAQGGSLADAIVALMNAMALERRRQLLERFPLSSELSTINSVDLVREDRDAR